MKTTSNPVRVNAELEPKLSRWLWLVKWFLAIPHYIVLAFLWIGFVLISVIALFAILFTGRYPRRLFDFNVGVLRWTWRVTYYAYGALGTDRYPPFTLRRRGLPGEARGGLPGAAVARPGPGEVVAPRHPALPRRWVVLGGGTWWLSVDNGRHRFRAGLIGVLVLIAAVVLLFTGRYPRDDLRPRRRHQPVGLPGGGLRRC